MLFAWNCFSLFTCAILKADRVHMIQQFVYLFILMGLGFEVRVLCLQSRHSAAWATFPVHFALVILEMGSQELFTWAGLEPQSSPYQPPRLLRLQAWATGTRSNNFFIGHKFQGNENLTCTIYTKTHSKLIQINPKLKINQMPSKSWNTARW
jgi:hypothetical protein